MALRWLIRVVCRWASHFMMFYAATRWNRWTRRLKYVGGEKCTVRQWKIVKRSNLRVALNDERCHYLQVPPLAGRTRYQICSRETTADHRPPWMAYWNARHNNVRDRDLRNLDEVELPTERAFRARDKNVNSTVHVWSSSNEHISTLVGYSRLVCYTSALCRPTTVILSDRLSVCLPRRPHDSP